MTYRVILSELAEKQLDNCLCYIYYEFTDAFAAKSFLEDAEDTLRRLSLVADGLPLCEDEALSKLGYRLIHFKRHRYKMLYRIVDSDVIVDAIYHNLQELKNPKALES